jgi:rare lipoprotein A
MLTRARSLSVRLLVAAAVLTAFGCRTTAPRPIPEGAELRGVASWYGQEFAGRTTANGEIFDPGLLTAAHRTLPFGTVLEVRNLKTHQMVRVRVNDRGPFVGKRIIDLSYAAAQQIGLIEAGIGDVELKVVSVGRGDREPPAPMIVDVAPQIAAVTPTRQEAPPEVLPIPQVAVIADEPAIVSSVSVIEEHGGVDTRRQVSADGRTIETVPAEGGPAVSAPGHSTAEAIDKPRASAPSRAPRPKRGEFVVQVGAFSVEENALALQERLQRIGQKSRVDHEELYRVRIGPFATRDEAVAVRAALEADGLSAIVVAE